MVRLRRSCRRARPATLVWTAFALLFCLVLRSAMEASSDLRKREPSAPASDRRSQLYDKLARDLDERGEAFLRDGETSQSLSLSDTFELRDGAVVPVLKAADPPVRANVLYLIPEYAGPISETVKEIFLPYFNGAEASAVKGVANAICPLKIVLDRIVLTSTGVLLGCWQVISGTDPTEIRAKLRTILPKAPEKQLYDPVLLHTSFARVLGHPKFPLEESKQHSDELHFFHELVGRVNKKLHGFQATVPELWFVEEYDVLALALNGRMKTRRFHLGCSGDRNRTE